MRDLSPQFSLSLQASRSNVKINITHLNDQSTDLRSISYLQPDQDKYTSIIKNTVQKNRTDIGSNICEKSAQLPFCAAVPYSYTRKIRM